MIRTFPSTRALDRHLRRTRRFLFLTLLSSLGITGANADDVLWSGGPDQGGSIQSRVHYWKTTANWEGGVLPQITDNAVIGDTAGSVNAYIEFDAIPISVGSITLSSGLTLHNQILESQLNTASLTIHGVNGILITNASIKQFQFTSSGGTRLPIFLAGSGDIGGATPTSTNLFYSTIGEIGGSFGINKTGPNLMVLNSNATYSGGTTISEGMIRLANASATLGSGPITLSGGELGAGASRLNAAPLSNSIVVTADSVISANGGIAGLANARYFLFSGPFSGDAGTLTFENRGESGNYFIPRLSGVFNFSRPIVLGNSGTRITLMQLYNAESDGVQTFSGDISGLGRVERTAGGTTIFTGNSTYAGGTTISHGKILANNASGSALGSGLVVITNLGVLGGNGTVGATVDVSLDGTLSPGASSTNVAKLAVNDLKLSDGANYIWQIKSASGTAGVDWDVVTANSVWDAATGVEPITIKIESLGVSPTGWNSAVARDWLILETSSVFGNDPSHYALDTTSFAGAVQGVFSLNWDETGLHLIYTPASDLVINVPTGIATQTEAGHPQLSGVVGMAKIGLGELVIDNPANDYLGSTKILAGKLSLSVNALNGSGGLGNSSTATFLGDTVGNSNATLNISVDGVTMARNIVVQSGSSGSKTIGTTLSSGTATFLGNITLQDNVALSASAGSTALFSGSFSSTGGLALNGGGSINLSGNGSYAGPTTVNVAALNLSGSALGTNTVTFASPTVLDNTNLTTVTLHNSPQNWNANLAFVGTTSLNLGAGPVVMNGNRTLAISNNTLTAGGSISGTAGLTKVGAGTLALGSANTYTGGTTNLEGTIALSGTATFGDGTGTLALSGGNISVSASHEGSAIANPVKITTDTAIFGTSTATAPSSSFLPFTGPFTVTGSTLRIGNTGRANNTFGVRLQGPNFSNINWPIVVGDGGFDTPGAISQLDLYSDTNAPTQIISSVISGAGAVRRGAVAPNTGGTTILTAPNTFAGGMKLTSGAIGFGASTTFTDGPIGTGLFTIGDQTAAESNMTVFAYGEARTIANAIFLNGARNVIVAGTNALTFTGPINAGGIAKTWTVQNTALTTLSGQITTDGGDGAPFIKAGTGVLELSADNLYSGLTTVRGGTLLVNNVSGSGTGSGNVTVQAGATIGGTGTVAGRITTTGGRISPGQGVGLLTIQGGVNLSNGGTYAWDLSSNSTDEGSFDVLAVTGGDVVLNGTSQISINLTGSSTTPTEGNAFWDASPSWIILTAASNPGLTKFPNIVGGSFPAGAFTNYADVNGNIVLQFIPGVTPPEQPTLEPNIVGAGTSNAILSWSSVNGVSYRVQYKTDLNQPNWITLDDVDATGNTASISDTTGPHPQIFYQVIVLP